jgi:hypothetical protein
MPERREILIIGASAPIFAQTTVPEKTTTVIIKNEHEPEEKSITNVFGPPPIIIHNYSATYLVENKIQPTGRQLRNQRRKKPKKNGRNRK